MRAGAQEGSMSINITVFSKDRACQLDLLFRSMKEHFVEFERSQISVILKYTNEPHKKAYEKLASDYAQINYFIEGQDRSFRQFTIESIAPSNEYTVFFVDDIAFKSKFSLLDHELSMMRDPENLCLSLRMNQGMNYCYPLRLKCRRMPTVENKRWKWRGFQGDWGYPMSLDGHVFRTNEILKILNAVEFSDPHLLELRLSRRPLPQEYMICYDKSVVFNNPLNRVHRYFNSPHAGVSQDRLVELYLQGKRLRFAVDLDTIEFVSPHFEVPVICD